MGNSCATPSTEKPKLIYWAVHGRSDFCQAMLYAGNIEFELEEDTANAWPAAKEETPFGQIPILKHGDLTIGQGGAINRYCARLSGLYPTDVQAAAQCDMYLEEVMDIFGGLFKGKFAEGDKAAAWKMLEEEFLPKHFGLLEKNLKSSGKSFLGGDKPNAADVAFWAVYNIYTKASVNTEAAISECPTLKTALGETEKLGNLVNFPDRNLYFSADPSSGAY